MKQQGVIQYWLSILSFITQRAALCLLEGGHASGLVFGGQAVLQVEVFMPVRLVSQSLFCPSLGSVCSTEVAVQSLICLRGMWLAAPLSSLLIVLALKCNQFGKWLCHSAQISCFLCLSLFVPREQAESLSAWFCGGMLSNSLSWSYIS